MTAYLTPCAAIVPDLLDLAATSNPPVDPDRVLWLRRLIAKRSEFGITRIGSITRLDRIGIPVVQVVRPLSLSNAVSQGKGRTWFQAIASALLETVESWAGENIAPDRRQRTTFRNVHQDMRALYEPWLEHNAPEDWDQRELSWLEGWDLFGSRIVSVPETLVDTIYTLPSPHPDMFPRTTTGLAAGRSLAQAITHAGLEILERDAIAAAHRIPLFFDLHQINIPAREGSQCSDLIAKITQAGLLYGLWQAPTPHKAPVYWCHLMESGSPDELAPLPSEGFGCDLNHEQAAEKAILEACQARATAISGAREDLTRRHYPKAHDRTHLAEWREQLARSQQPPLPRNRDDEDAPELPRMEQVLEALRQAGAVAAVAVPLFCDLESGIYVVRLLAPPLRLDPRA